MQTPAVDYDVHPAAHGVTGSVSSNNLDRIIFNQIRDELRYWGKDPGPTIAGIRQ